LSGQLLGLRAGHQILVNFAALNQVSCIGIAERIEISMNCAYKTIACWLTLLIIFSTFSFYAHAQKISQYQGKVPLVSGDSATVQYEFYESRGVRILQGNYQLSATTSRQQDSLSFEKILWKGTFNKNTKQGDWDYQYQQHKVWVSDVAEFNVKTSLTSEYSSLDAYYNEGSPDGKWTFTQHVFEQGERKATLAEGSLRFSNGVLVDAFQFTSRKPELPVVIRGRFDDEGFLHDAWQLDYMQDSVRVQEIRVYDHGFLLSLVKTKRASSDTIQWIVFDDVVSKLQNLKDESGSNFSRDASLHELPFDTGYDADSPKLETQQAGNVALQTVIREFLFLDTAFRSNNKQVFGTARFRFPVSEKDMEEIAQIKSLLDSITFDLGRVRNKNFFELSNQQSDSLAWSYEFLKNYPVRLVKFYSMASFISSPAFQLVDPEIYFLERSGLLSNRDTVRYTYDDGTHVKVLTFLLNPVTDITSFRKRVEEERDLVNQVVRYVNDELKSVLQSFQLQKLDSIILAVKAEIDNQYKQINNEEVQYYASIFDKRFLNTEFNHLKRGYTASNDFEEKLAIGYDILNFLDAVQSFPEKLERIVVTRDSIETLYTESRLDPYTFTYVDTKLKKRLYEKLAEELFLSMMETITETSKVETVEEQLEDVETLQKLIIRFRNQKTTQLEKQIKPKASPEEIRKLIGL
jgi:hypothetical protein